MVLFQTFSTPNHHPRSKPFIDHVVTFSIADNRIWFRNFQILQENGELVEIGEWVHSFDSMVLAIDFACFIDLCVFYIKLFYNTCFSAVPQHCWHWEGHLASKNSTEAIFKALLRNILRFLFVVHVLYYYSCSICYYSYRMMWCVKFLICYLCRSAVCLESYPDIPQQFWWWDALSESSLSVSKWG